MRLLVDTASALLLLVAAGTPPPPTFDPEARAVSTWRQEAIDNLELSAGQEGAMRDPAGVAAVARCVKLNNYWCVKHAGWKGELASDDEGHVAFASAKEGAAVAALLLKRYYMDFDRKTALAIVSHWAPAQCATGVGPLDHPMRSRAVGALPPALRGTLRAHWLAGHLRGFDTPVAGRPTRPGRSTGNGPVHRTMPTPAIARGLAAPTKPMTLDALLRASPNAPPSRSMIGMPGKMSTAHAHATPLSLDGLAGCPADGGRIANYAAKAAAGIAVADNGDLGLFKPDGTPTANLTIMMGNMAKVEIGPAVTKPDLIAAGIDAAFQPGRNPEKP